MTAETMGPPDLPPKTKLRLSITSPRLAAERDERRTKALERIADALEEMGAIANRREFPGESDE